MASSGTSETERKSKALSFAPASRLHNFLEPTVWHEFTPLANQSKAINLGQGFPGWSPPDFVKRAAAECVEEKGLDFMTNQYARSAGCLSLVNRIADKYTKIVGQPVNALTDVIVTVGATEALYLCMMGLLNPGDEVLTLEPAFDLYSAQADMAGATLKTVSLRVVEDDKGKKSWKLDIEELAKAFSPKTRILLLNNPHNPSGKVLSRAELSSIAELLKRHPDVVVVADEVYEHLTYDESRHITFASLPDMWQRTITISSAGKTFSVTGWKIGWAVAPEHLTRCLGIAHSWVAFSTCTPLQEAVSRMMDTAQQPYQGSESYYGWLAADYAKRRDTMAEALRQAGIEPIMPEGSFFIVGDTSKLQIPDKWLEDKSVTRDWALCRWLTVDIGVAAIPVSAFYAPETKHLASNYARFAFCKPDEVLAEAAKRLLKLKDFIKKD